MKLKNLTKEELELMAYDDIAYMILTENGKKMKIQGLFKKLCTILNLSDSEFEQQIGDFFELLSTDKRFIMLPEGYWDLKINHTQKILIEDDDDDIIIEIPEEEEEKSDTIFYDDNGNEEDADDGLQDLVVIDPEAEEADDV